MIGNSIKSDVLPVLELGGTAIHVPYHITWIHEEVSHTIDHPDFYKIKNLGGSLWFRGSKTLRA
jgi:putative hydrolase of the HAD superfamily